MFISVSSFAYTAQEALRAVKDYRPYTNSYESIETISAIYATRVFYEYDFKTWLYSKLTDNIFIVTSVFSVGKPKSEVLEKLPELVQEEIKKAGNELRLDWRVDMNNEEVRPHNYLAKDSLSLYEKMIEMLGVTLHKRF